MIQDFYVAFISFHDLNHDELWVEGYYKLTGGGLYTRMPDHFSIEFSKWGELPFSIKVIDILPHQEYGYTYLNENAGVEGY